MRRPSPAAVPPWAWVALMAATQGAVLAWLSVARHRAFWTGRFDLGNMVQAVWSTAHGRPLETTDMFGEQIVRLGAHVDPLLLVFTPFAWTGALPEAMLVGQALAVAAGAFPAFWLGRRWLGGDGWGLVAAAAWLLYPPMQWAVVTDVHAVTLAAPLLMACIWAAEERRWAVLAVCAPLAALGKEQVGLALAVLGIWLAVRGARRAGAALAAAGVAWSVICVAVIIPRYAPGEGSAFLARYGHLGDSEWGIVQAVVTRPWEVADLLLEPARIVYLGALLAPLLFLPLAAPLLAAGALPDLAINLLSDLPAQHQVRFHYTAVIAPFLVAAAILGLANARERWERRRGRVPGHARAVAGALLGAVALAGVALGPLPWWSHVPGGSDERAGTYAPGSHAAAARAAVAMVPGGVPVSAGNTMGAHLSARERVLLFPVVAEARWVVVDRRRPYVGDRRDPVEHAARVDALRADPAWEPVYDVDGVMVFRRRAR